MKRAVWYTWEEHRRSRELAGKFGVRYLALTSSLSNPWRYMVLSIRTIFSLLRRRPDIIFCQNPSIILAFLLCVTRPLHRAPVVIDRHTNFYFEHANSQEWKWKLHNFLGRWTDSAANLVIVTTERLADFVRSEGGNSAVLPDPLPDWEPSLAILQSGAPARVVFIGSGGEDEPLAEVFGAARSLGTRIQMTVTSGGAKRAARNLNPPENVEFPGYLPHAKYIEELRSADVVLVLTTQEDTLCCGVYEAICLHRPVVISGTQAMRCFFSEGVIYTDNEARAIAEAITSVLVDWQGQFELVSHTEPRMRASWSLRFSCVQAEVRSLIESGC